ncbi:hypothetical protein [Neisseria chenwenguii]|nr:hypothetical protein [Neisseria chenwenguii]
MSDTGYKYPTYRFSDGLTNEIHSNTQCKANQPSEKANLFRQ